MGGGSLARYLQKMKGMGAEDIAGMMGAGAGHAIGATGAAGKFAMNNKLPMGIGAGLGAAGGIGANEMIEGDEEEELAMLKKRLGL